MNRTVEVKIDTQRVKTLAFDLLVENGTLRPADEPTFMKGVKFVEAENPKELPIDVSHFFVEREIQIREALQKATERAVKEAVFEAVASSLRNQ